MENVRIERRGDIAIVTIDRPKARNALDARTIEEIAATFAGLRSENVRCVVLTGAGDRAFVAGADIAAMAALTPAEASRFAGLGQAALNAIEDFPAPVIAAVNGFALGGGCELAMACDIILAAKNAVFGQPEVKLGVIPGFGGTQRLVRRVGSMRARELIYTGRTVSADEAVAIGLALRVVEGSVLDAAIELAGVIAAQGPVAVRLAKRAVLDADGSDLRTGLAGERNLFALCFATADQREGMSAFLEKRPARFEGA